ncbi:VanZ family protein [Sporosalibacterium faouarense]|uniref:VanZ family protein n=1 Tax=Sporosalibacterium faouarense TaxID=516123 RepID=UPI00192C5D35|nr:VanZ family protein [Sporosalibacterium faouarense]
MKSRNKFVIIIYWLAVFLWMLLIFNMSSKVAEESNKLSKGITEIVIEKVDSINPDNKFDVDSLNHIIRKNAHFFSYLVLGVLVINALRRSGASSYKSIILSLAICITYAISDEFHQAFVPGRGPQIKDVFIDSFGATIGVSIYLIINRLMTKRIINR